MMASGSAHRFTYAGGKDHIVVEQICLCKETGPELCILHVPDGTLPEPVRVELSRPRLTAHSRSRQSHALRARAGRGFAERA
jgi:hypothetical protein